MNREQIMDKILDSRDATIGGGSASALAAAMAAGLGGMVARLSAGKDWGLTDAEYLQMADRLDTLANQLVEGSIRDAAAFAEISSAFKFPRSSEAEKNTRSKAINQAAVSAAAAPLDNSRLTLELIEIMDRLIGNHNTGAESDLMIGRRLLDVAIYGFAANIKANLPLIKDEAALEKFETAAEKLFQRVN